MSWRQVVVMVVNSVTTLNAIEIYSQKWSKRPILHCEYLTIIRGIRKYTQWLAAKNKGWSRAVTKGNTVDLSLLIKY